MNTIWQCDMYFSSFPRKMEKYQLICNWKKGCFQEQRVEQWAIKKQGCWESGDMCPSRFQICYRPVDTVYLLFSPFGTGVSIVIMLSLSHHFILEVWSGGMWLVSLVHRFFVSRGSYTWRTTPFGNLSCMWPLFKWRDRLWADIIMGWNFEFLGARGECTLHIRRIGILWPQGQLWQILFSKDRYNNTYHPTCWLTVLTLLCPTLKKRSVFSEPLNLGGTQDFPWNSKYCIPIEYNWKDTLPVSAIALHWLPGSAYCIVEHLFSEFPTWNSVLLLWEAQSRWRGYVQVLQFNSPSWQPASNNNQLGWNALESLQMTVASSQHLTATIWEIPSKDYCRFCSTLRNERHVNNCYPGLSVL